MVWLCFPGMTSSLANHRCTLKTFFSTIFLFLTFLNIHIYFIILKTYDQQFTLTTKKSLHIIFNTGPYTALPDNSILITANMQSETGFPSSHQLKWLTEILLAVDRKLDMLISRQPPTLLRPLCKLTVK